MKQFTIILATLFVFLFADNNVFAQNLAKGKTVRQSTTGYGGLASRAVDGNTNGNYNAGSVTHTERNDRNQWWEVDLGQVYDIGTIKIFNRTDCCMDRLKDIYILVSENPIMATDWQAHKISDYYAYHEDFKVGQANPIVHNKNARGRYVRIFRQAGAPLSLAEVEIYAGQKTEPTPTSIPSVNIIKGYNVNYVAYTGSESGSFEQSGGNKWIEYKKGSRNPHATFTETGRDEWSVYLRKSDGANIQLDLHTKKVSLNRSSLYQIVEAKFVLNGYSANYVAYTGSESGSFEQSGGNKWIEYKKGSRRAHATFTETGRDEWSIYLTKSDGARLQLDLHTKKITFNRNPLYTVAEAKFIINGYNVNYVEYGGREAGRFEQTGDKTWREMKSGRGGVHATFTETGRDEWSVYMTKSDGARIQLDLHTKKVSVNRSALYEIKQVFAKLN
ncbi:MAG: discoidin domain-containing protein [Chitinophagales bacterium]